MKSSNALKNDTEAVFKEDDTVQVLALDGGGLKGLYTASVIKALEDQLGHSICDHFDIVTGTSTGGLIALALSQGKSGEDIQRFYLENGHLIFPAGGFFKGKYKAFMSLFRAKYSNQVLEKTVKLLLEQQDGVQPILGHSNKRLVIPSFLSGVYLPRLLKTPHSARYKSDWKMPMWAVGLATSAAPTYLPSFKYDGKSYLDGGLWANNPSLIGVVEAIDLGAQMKNVKVLNIGTTYSDSDSVYWYPLSRMFKKFKFRRSGLVSWAKQVLPSVMDANSYATTSMYVHQLLAKGHSFVINKQVNHGELSLDKVDNDKLQEIGENDGVQNFSQLEKLFTHVASDYEPNKEAMNNGVK